MRVYESKDVRNAGIVGHGHCGKTTLAAALLYTAGATSRLTRVEEGNTPRPTSMKREIQRKLTISSAIGASEWKAQGKTTKINLLDTPGFNIFLNDTRASLIAADAVLVVVDAVAGVELQTEKTWSFAEAYKQPRAIIINKLDRERSDFDRTIESIHDRFGRTAVALLQLPIVVAEGLPWRDRTWCA